MRNNKISHVGKCPTLSLVALILFVGIVIFTLSGCSSSANSKVDEIVERNDTRFTSEVFNINSYASVHIITDSETGEQYLFYKYGSQGGLTKLENGE